MSDNEQMPEQDNIPQTNGSRESNWIKGQTILVAVGLVITVALAFFAVNEVSIEGPVISATATPQSAQFEFQSINATADTDEYVLYEITSELANIRIADDEDTYGVTTDISVQVNARRPDDIVGIVTVMVNPANSEAFEWARWRNFPTEYSEPITVALTPFELLDYSGLEREFVLGGTYTSLPEERRGEFEIQIMQNDEVLDERTVRVEHTPWLHNARLNDYVVSSDDPVDVAVTIMNLGQTGEFTVNTILYEVTDTDPATLAFDSDGWWPGETMGEPVWSHDSEVINLDQNATERININVNSDEIEPCQSYVVETNVMKNVPYVSYSDGTWQTSDFQWRTRDTFTFSNLFVRGSVAECEGESS